MTLFEKTLKEIIVGKRIAASLAENFRCHLPAYVGTNIFADIECFIDFVSTHILRQSDAVCSRF